MKLVQILKNGKPSLGVWTEQGVIDVHAEAVLKGITVPGDMWEVIGGGKPALELLSKLAMRAECYIDAASCPLAPVITGTDRIFCIGLNYRQHAMECGLPLPPAPALFNKFGNALAAHNQTITLPADYREYDYEAELVIVMGKRTRNVSETEALDYVFGYTCGNDLSTRDLQFARGGQWDLSKNLDGFAPIGPCVATAEELDPVDVRISSRVNGELRQDARTSDMIFSAAQIIADLSRHLTLMPGDLIFTGTPHGVMHGYPADAKNWLKPGDTVEIGIEGIGTLRNTLY